MGSQSVGSQLKVLVNSPGPGTRLRIIVISVLTMFNSKAIFPSTKLYHVAYGTEGLLCKPYFCGNIWIPYGCLQFPQFFVLILDGFYLLTPRIIDYAIIPQSSWAFYP